MDEATAKPGDTRMMTRLRQVLLAITGLSAAMADALILLRPELMPEKLPAGLAWVSLVFILLVPVSAVDHLPFLKSMPRRALIVGPLILAAAILVPALMMLGKWAIWGLGLLSLLALIDSILVCWRRLGLSLLWLWALALMILGVAFAAILPMPTGSGPLTAWLTAFAANPWIRPGADINAAAIGHIVLVLPFLAAGLAVGGSLLGAFFHEQSSTAIPILALAIFLALLLPVLGFGASALTNGAHVTAFAALGFSLPPLFLLATKMKDEPARFSPFVWAYALLLVPTLAVLTSAVGLIWVIILTAWILDGLGVKNRQAWAMIAGAWIVWLGIEGWPNHWAVLGAAAPLSFSGILGLASPDRLAGMVGPIFAAAAILLLSVIGQRRGAAEPQRLVILCLAILLVAALVPPVLLSLPIGILQTCLDATYWLLAPFLLAEILTLLAKAPAVKIAPFTTVFKRA